MEAPMGWKAIRVYFRDHHHQQSYLSFPTEEEAVNCVRRVRDRLQKITLEDEVSGVEIEDKKASRRLKAAASRKTA